MAWLDTAPNKAEGDRSQDPEPTNREARDAAGFYTPMPPCSATYLTDYLFEMGPITSTGMGITPIDHSGIAAWQKNIGIDLSPWECRTLRRLSIEYVKQHNAAKDRACPMPYSDEETEISNREAVSNQVKTFMQFARK